MTTLHMETEKVHAVAKLLDHEATQMLTSLSQMQSSASRLSYAWQGGGADDFRHDLTRLMKKIENQVVALETLSIRVSREVDEWSSKDTFGHSAMRRTVLNGSMLFGGATFLSAAPSAALLQESSRTPLWLEEHFRYGVDGGFGGSRLSKTGKQNWHRSKPKLEIGAKAGIDGSIAEGQYHSWGNWEVGAKVGVDEKGKWDAGLYAEGSVFEASRSGVIGSSMFGFTATGAVAAGSGEAFLGMKDNRVGASIGASLVSGEIGVGMNLFGYNIGLSGGAGLGLEAGFKIGAKTQAKLGPFKLGISIGKAVPAT